MSKETFVFYRSFYEAIKNLPESEQLKLYNAICEYSFTDNIPDLPEGIAKAMFILMKPNIDSANARYKASVENGRKGGRPKKETQQKPNNNLDITQTKPSQNLNDNDNDNVNDNNNNNNNIVDIEQKKKERPKRSKFVPPTLEEVQAYCIERNNTVDPIKFYDYYNAGNWSDSQGNKIKNWKQKLITWEKRQQPNQGGNISGGTKYGNGSLYANLER